MTDKKSDDSRRKLLKSIAAGSGAVVAGKSLPESWSKPVINSVILPAHAETTDGSGSSGDGATTTPQCCLTTGLYCGGSDVIFASPSPPYIEIDVAADGTLKIEVERSGYAGPYTGSTGIACTGGKFSAELTLDSSSKSAGDTVQVTIIVTVSGTVTCGDASIPGTIYWNTDDFSYDVTQTCFA